MADRQEIPGVELWRMFPHLYAERMSGGKWVPYDYLCLIGQTIFRALYQARLTGVGGRIVIHAPPRHGKSEFVSKWLPIWFLDTNPDKRVILASYGAELASNWGRKARNELQAGKGIEVSVAEDSSAANRWATPEGGGMMTAGVGGPLTGLGGDLLIADDLIKNWEEAESAVKRQMTWDWFISTFYTRAEPAATIIVMMTRWNEDDVAGRLLSGFDGHADKWTEIWLPAISEAGDSLKSRLPGEALCPERYNEAALLGADGNGGIRRSMGTVKWNALYRGRPSSAAGNVIKRDWIRFYDELPEGIQEYGQSWDLNFDDEGADNAFVSGQVWARKRADFYLVEQAYGVWDYVQSEKEFIKQSVKWKRAAVRLIERAANGFAMISRLKKRIPRLRPIKPKGSKLARLKAVAPVFESGNVWFPNPNKPGNAWVLALIEEVVNMPNSKYKDQVDALSQMLKYWENRWVRSIAPGSLKKSPSYQGELDEED